MFSVLSGHLIIVPIISLWWFSCTKYTLLECVCESFGAHSDVWSHTHTHTSPLIALIPLFMKSQLRPWTSEIMHAYVHVCVWTGGGLLWDEGESLLSHWTPKQKDEADGSSWSYIKERVCLCVLICVHVCEKSLLFVLCNLCFPHVFDVEKPPLAREANCEGTEKTRKG